MPLPADHPLRFELNDEAHARPPEALVPPQRLSYLALLSDLVAARAGAAALWASWRSRYRAWRRRQPG